MWNGPSALLSFDAIKAGEKAILLGSGPHERDLGIVNMKPPVPKGLGHGRQGAEIHHVQGPRARGHRGPLL